MPAYLERHGTGQPIVFIHGAGAGSNAWYFQREHFKKSMEVVLVDLPGRNRAAGPRCTSIQEYADTVRDALAGAGITHFWLVGQSMGGAIAMTLALQAPEMLKGLILVTTGAKLGVFPEILEGLLKDKETTVRRIMELAFSPKAKPALIEGGVAELLKSDAEVIYGDFMACEQFDLRGRVAEISVPTLIVCGQDDVLTPPKFSEYLQREIKGSQLVVVPDAGHMVMIEKPGVLNSAIETFVRD